MSDNSPYSPPEEQVELTQPLIVGNNSRRKLIYHFGFSWIAINVASLITASIIYHQLAIYPIDGVIIEDMFMHEETWRFLQQLAVNLSWLFVIIPFIIFGAEKLLDDHKKRWHLLWLGILLAAFSMTFLVILSGGGFFDQLWKNYAASSGIGLLWGGIYGLLLLTNVGMKKKL